MSDPKTDRRWHLDGPSDPKTDRRWHPDGLSDPKTDRRWHPDGVSDSKTDRRWHPDGLRGEKRGAFFTVLGCVVKNAVCFLQFLGARSKRRPVFHLSLLRGEKGGAESTATGCAVKKAGTYTTKKTGSTGQRSCPDFPSCRLVVHSHSIVAGGLELMS